MPTNKSSHNDHGTSAVATAPGSSTHLAPPISFSPQREPANLIEKVMLQPTQQHRIPLGSFTKENQPKGFLVEIDADTKPADSVISEVKSLGDARRYTLTMHLANAGTQTVGVEIWRL